MFVDIPRVTERTRATEGPEPSPDIRHQAEALYRSTYPASRSIRGSTWCIAKQLPVLRFEAKICQAIARRFHKLMDMRCRKSSPRGLCGERRWPPASRSNLLSKYKHNQRANSQDYFLQQVHRWLLLPVIATAPLTTAGNTSARVHGVLSISSWMNTQDRGADLRQRRVPTRSGLSSAGRRNLTIRSSTSPSWKKIRCRAVAR